METFGQIPSSFTVCDENLFPKCRNASPTSNRMAPLLGKKLFLHYEPGTPRDKKMELILKKLKADLVDFFSRDVDYIVTNRSQKPITPTPSLNARKDNITISPPSHLSIPGKSAFQHLKTPKLNSDRPVSTVTRGRAMLLAAQKATGSNLSEVGQISSSSSLPSSVLRQLQPTTTTTTIAPDRVNRSSSLLVDKIPTVPSTDLLSRARQLGIKIITMDTVVKWIRNLPSDVQSYIQSVQRIDSDDGITELPDDPERDRVYEVRLLAPPCIKIVDIQNQTKPLYLDHTEYLPSLWNLINKPKSKFQPPLLDKDGHSTAQPRGQGLTTNSGSVPMPSLNLGQSHPTHLAHHGPQAPSILIRQDSRSKKKYQRLRKHTRTANQSQRMTSTQPQNERQNDPGEGEPSGYCECCSLAFKNLFEHMHSVDHVQFATNAENYRLLDDVLEKLPSIKEFLDLEMISPYANQETTANRKKLVGQKRKNRPVTPKSDTVKPVAVVQTPDEKPPKENEQSTTPNIPDTPPVLNIPQTDVSQSVSLANRVPMFDEEEDDGNDIGDADEPDNKIGNNLSKICDSVHLLLENASKEIYTSTAADPTQNANNHDNQEHDSDLQIAPDSDDKEHLSPVLNALDRSPNLTQSVAANLVDAWQTVCSCVSITTTMDKSGSIAQSPEPIVNKSLKTSPVLEIYHKRCSSCSRSHIPSVLRPEIQLPVCTMFGPACQFDGVGCNGGLYLQGETSSPCITPEDSPNFQKSPEPRPPILSPAHCPEPSQSNLLGSPIFESHDSIHPNDQNSGSPCPNIPLLSSESTLPTSPMVHQSQVNCEETELSYSLKNCSPSVESAIPNVSCDNDSVNKKSTSSSCISQNSSSNSRRSLRIKRKRHRLSFISTPTYHMTDPNDSDSSPDNDNLSVDKNQCSDPLTRAFRLGQLPLQVPSQALPISDQQIRSPPCPNKTNPNSAAHLKPLVQDTGLLCNLPVLRRAKFFGKRNSISVDSDDFELKSPKSTCLDENQNDFPVNPYFTSPQHKRTARLAAVVARESISLSVKALFSPSGLDRNYTCPSSDLRKSNLNPSKHSTFIAESVQTPSTEPSRMQSDKQSTDSSYSPWDLVTGSTESRIILRRHYPRHSSSFFTTPRPANRQSNSANRPQNQTVKRSLFPAFSTPSRPK